MEWAAGFKFLIGALEFPITLNMSREIEVHPSSYPMGKTRSFPGRWKVAVPWKWPLDSAQSRVKNPSVLCHHGAALSKLMLYCITVITRGSFTTKGGFISHTITIDHNFLFTALEATIIITLEITVLDKLIFTSFSLLVPESYLSSCPTSDTSCNG